MSDFVLEKEVDLDPTALDVASFGDAAFARELIVTFLAELDQLGVEMSSGDLERQAKAAHSTKASSGYLGARRLARLCLAIEHHARAGEIAEVDCYRAELPLCVDTVRHLLSRQLS